MLFSRRILKLACAASCESSKLKTGCAGGDVGMLSRFVDSSQFPLLGCPFSMQNCPNETVTAFLPGTNLMDPHLSTQA